jgi:urease accessory protein
MLTLTDRSPADPNATASLTIALTAEERTRSRDRFFLPDGQAIDLRLPRGSVLADGDLLQSEAGDILVRITAKPEPVLTVTASDRLDLLRAAYHLGNRHIALEITTDYLRLSPDPVLQAMVEQLGLQVVAEIAPFHPEKGAYSHL